MFPLRSISSGCEAKPNHRSKRYLRRFPSSTTCVGSKTMSDTEEAPLPPARQVVSASPHAPPPPQIYNFPRNFPVSAAMVCRGDIPIGNFQAKMARLWSSDWFGSKESTGTVSNVPFRCGKRVPADFRNLNLAPVKIPFLHHWKHWRIILSPSGTWFTKGMCLILVVKHPTKLLTVLSIA